jgi:hypothetical protein
VGGGPAPFAGLRPSKIHGGAIREGDLKWQMAKFKWFTICHLLFAICHLKFSYRRPDT